MTLIATLALVLLLTSCSIKNPMQSNTCEEPVLASVICAIKVRKKEDHQAEMVINYQHTGEYGRIYKVLVIGYGGERTDVIGSLKTKFAYPGRNKAFIPLGFLPDSGFAEEVYNTVFFRVQFLWLDEARNS